MVFANCSIIAIAFVTCDILAIAIVIAETNQILENVQGGNGVDLINDYDHSEVWSKEAYKTKKN